MSASNFEKADNRTRQANHAARTPVVSQFTDREISDLLRTLREKYTSLESEQANSRFIQMYESIDYLLQYGKYAGYSLHDKDLVTKVFCTYMTARDSAFPDFHKHRVQANQAYRSGHPANAARYNHITIKVYSYDRSSSWFTELLFWHWMMSCSNRGNYHGRGTGDDFLKALLVIIVAAVVLAALYFSLGYLMNAALESLERFKYNEGWLQGSITLISMAAGAATCAMLMTSMLTPFGLLPLVVVVASIVAAAVSAVTVNAIQQKCIQAMNPDELDPNDPHRYMLTTREAERLNKNGYDPIKVKCAIVLLREKIGELPTAFSRMYTSKHNVALKQQYLMEIRRLRQLPPTRNDRDKVIIIDGVTYDLKLDAEPQVLTMDEVAYDVANDLDAADKNRPSAYAFATNHPVPRGYVI
jgi:hypothetical protein